MSSSVVSPLLKLMRLKEKEKAERKLKNNKLYDYEIMDLPTPMHRKSNSYVPNTSKFDNKLLSNKKHKQCKKFKKPVKTCQNSLDERVQEALSQCMTPRAHLASIQPVLS